jgi:quinol monooxygenase YgiN
MFVVFVSVHVKQDRLPQFTEAILDNARNTRREPGNVRFDIL